MTFIVLCLIGWGIWSMHGKLNSLNRRLAALATAPTGESAALPEVLSEGKQLLVKQAMGIGLARIAWRVFRAWC